MKTRLIFLVLLIVCFSCGTNNTPVSDAQKEKIKGEVKEVVNTMFKGCEEANFEMTVESFLDSPDFVFLTNGYALSYKDFVDGVKPLFGTLLNQKVTIKDEKFVFLDKSTVLYTTNCKFLENYKDGHSSLNDPTAILCILKKINNKWRIIYAVESYVKQSVVGIETPKELNQVELLKQMVGSWKLEMAKDTVVIFDFKTYGTGLEGYIKFVAKGKTYSEAKQLWGYDRKIDKYILSFLIKGMDMENIAFWFVSKSKFEVIPLSDLSNPEMASWKYEGEFKSPDMYIETLVVNNKPVKTDTYTRVK